jgi:hypothetical protein
VEGRSFFKMADQKPNVSKMMPPDGSAFAAIIRVLMQMFNSGHLQGFLTNLDAIANQKQPVVESDNRKAIDSH